MNKKIEGFIAAPLTGFHPDGSLNLDIVPRYAAMLYSNGIAGVFVNGTTGEGQTLTFEEKLALAKCWVDAAPEGLRVIIHVGYAEQAKSQALAIHAAEIGADGVGEIGPFILEPFSVETLVDYVARTASASPKIPYYYYHMPSMNNVLFPMIDFLRLADDAIPNLAGIKYTHDDIVDYEKCYKFKNKKYDLLFGRDEFLVDGLKAGAKGAVGSTYNIMAGLYLELVEAYRSGNIETAKHLQEISANTCRLLYESGNFRSALKFVMSKIGLDLGGMRHPEVDLSEKTTEELEKSLWKSDMFNFFNKCNL